jgi:hypothetical protein
MKLKLAFTSLVVVLGLSAGAALFFDGAEQTRANDVQVREDGVVIAAAAQADDAIDQVSQRVGFEVRLPSSVPSGLKLDFVDSALGPTGAPNALKLALLSYGPADSSRIGTVSVRVEQTGVRFATPDERAQKIDLGVPGVEAYFQATERARGYWVFTADRGFLVTATGANAPSDAELREMIASLFP